MEQNYYLISETDFDRLRSFSESFHFAMVEFIESRKVKNPPWEEDDEKPEYQNFQSIYEELDLIAQEKFEF